MDDFLDRLIWELDRMSPFEWREELMLDGWPPLLLLHFSCFNRCWVVLAVAVFAVLIWPEMDGTVCESNELLGERMMVGVASDDRVGTSIAHWRRNIVWGNDCCFERDLLFPTAPVDDLMDDCGDFTTLSSDAPKGLSISCMDIGTWLWAGDTDSRGWEWGWWRPWVLRRGNIAVQPLIHQNRWMMDMKGNINTEFTYLTKCSLGSKGRQQLLFFFLSHPLSLIHSISFLLFFMLQKFHGDGESFNWQLVKIKRIFVSEGTKIKIMRAIVMVMMSFIITASLKNRGKVLDRSVQVLDGR